MKLKINFPYASKDHKNGFSFYIPKYLHKLFDKYKKRLAHNGRLLRNWSDGMIEEKLGLPKKSLAACFGRRSGAVALADEGISMPNLNCAGRWSSTLAVEEYREQRHASKKECLILLDTKKGKQRQKEQNGIERSSAK
eukprot:9642031-Ditylum_brightwellii.AAC.1